MPSWFTNQFQDPNSPIMYLMFTFHDESLLILALIMMLIIYSFTFMSINKYINRNILHGHLIEFIWTITPMFLLIILANPSLKILYLYDENPSPHMTIKSTGHQWYWNYEYNDFKNVSFDSFMLNSLNLNSFRLLDVDNRLIIPFNLIIRILSTSNDVIHSWTVPSLGVKMDATPGRMNQSYLMMYKPGLFFGQCSEICGINHSFMPICIESTNIKNFIKWMMKF